METSTTLSSSHFTESLNNYLHSNKKPEQFFLGHWLITLTDEELAYLCDQNSDIYDKDRETDALGVVVLALLAETKKMEFCVFLIKRPTKTISKRPLKLIVKKPPMICNSGHS